MAGRLRRLGAAALNQTPLDVRGNTARVIEAIAQAKAAKVELLLLPELCLSGYGCEDVFLSDWLSPRCIEALGEVVPETEGITVSVGLPLKFEGRRYNCAVLIENQKILGISVKQFLAIDGVHYESRWFTHWKPLRIEQYEILGQTVPFGDVVYDWNGVKVAYEICEDAWRANRPAPRHVARGVELMLNPSASPFALGKWKRREDLIVGTSKTFDCTYLYANLVGNESGRLIFDGEILLAQKGELLAANQRLRFEEVQLIHAEVDMDATAPKGLPTSPSEAAKEEDFPAAVALGLFDYLRKSRSKGFVVSLSGGADSACCAVMVSEMFKRATAELGFGLFLKRTGLGYDCTEQDAMKHLLTCAYQGTENSSETTRNAAREVALDLACTYYEWEVDAPIDEYVQRVEKALGRELTWAMDDVTLQNIQARSRAPIIWMLANEQNALLLTTSNRSEGSVGYTTMDGDTAGGLAPIAGIDKAYLREWLKWAEVELDYPALGHINVQQPTAELRPLENKQTDEGDLMPYPVLQAIEALAIGKYRSPVEVYLALKDELKLKPELLKQYIRRFFRLWSQNQWKRERIAPSFHLDEYNVDPRSWYRFPILSSGFAQELDAMDQLD